MNVYDFDETIFYPNSSWTFGNWCFKRNTPRTLLFVPLVIWAAIQYLFGRIDKDIFNLKLFCFMRFVRDPEKEVKEFWDEYEGQISEWYLKQKRDDDVIVSASPDFLIDEIGRRLGVRVIATKMDIHTGNILSKNCAGEEKVKRFRKVFPDGKIEKFYSDSLRDSPMAKLADEAYMIVDKAKRPIPWPEDN